MSLSIVMIGDIVGKPGRRVVDQQVQRVREDCEADLVIANAENIAGGSGLTAALAERLFSYGIDGLTLGDHVYRKADIIPMLERTDRVCRPANLPEDAVGPRFLTLPARDGSRTLCVLTVLGRLYMSGGPLADDPFAAVDMILHELPSDAAVLVEVHAEATSEKVALGHHLDGRVSAVVGTHTHIPTADARVLPGGTAYVTDLGMTGPYDSVLGRRKDRVLQFMTTAIPARFDVAEGDVKLCGVHITLDDANKATACRRLEYPADLDRPPFAE